MDAIANANDKDHVTRQDHGEWERTLDLAVPPCNAQTVAVVTDFTFLSHHQRSSDSPVVVEQTASTCRTPCTPGTSTMEWATSTPGKSTSGKFILAQEGGDHPAIDPPVSPSADLWVVSYDKEFATVHRPVQPDNKNVDVSVAESVPAGTSLPVEVPAVVSDSLASTELFNYVGDGNGSFTVLNPTSGSGEFDDSSSTEYYDTVLYDPYVKTRRVPPQMTSSTYSRHSAYPVWPGPVFVGVGIVVILIGCCAPYLANVTAAKWAFVTLGLLVVAAGLLLIVYSRFCAVPGAVHLLRIADAKLSMNEGEEALQSKRRKLHETETDATFDLETAKCAEFRLPAPPDRCCRRVDSSGSLDDRRNPKLPKVPSCRRPHSR